MVTSAERRLPPMEKAMHMEDVTLCDWDAAVRRNADQEAKKVLSPIGSRRPAEKEKSTCVTGIRKPKRTYHLLAVMGGMGAS